MKLSKRSWLLVLAILIIGSTTSLAQSRINLVQGKRAINDKVNFVVEFAHMKNQQPPYPTISDEMQIFTRFVRPATGMVYLDGKAIGRFDEAMAFTSNIADATYGRHTITLMFTNPAVVTDFYVTLFRGAASEILEGEDAFVTTPTSLEKRVVELEHKVHELEAEIATLKKKRVQ
ncbi:MAG: hypothetical protein DMF68_01085 [Acidobacteria bacterium]|nr:MAG: hypothetical protein DMF68_01085 [Acidobacteriota bacterium]